MADRVKLTEAQDKWFRRGNELGQIKWRGPRGYGRSVYERVMKALQAKGLVTPNAFDEYEYTESGRALLASTQQAEKPKPQQPAPKPAYEPPVLSINGSECVALNGSRVVSVTSVNMGNMKWVL